MVDPDPLRWRCNTSFSQFCFFSPATLLHLFRCQNAKAKATFGDVVITVESGEICSHAYIRWVSGLTQGWKRFRNPSPQFQGNVAARHDAPVLGAAFPEQDTRSYDGYLTSPYQARSWRCVRDSAAAFQERCKLWRGTEVMAPCSVEVPCCPCANAKRC